MEGKYNYRFQLNKVVKTKEEQVATSKYYKSMKKKSPSKSTISPPNKKDFMTTIYGIMAVIFVLIPEWIAEYGITIGNNQFKNILPENNSLLSRNQDLTIYGMNIKELRKVALELKLMGYASENKQRLSRRIIRRLKRKRINNLKIWNEIWNKLC